MRNAVRDWKQKTLQNSNGRTFNFDDITSFLFEEKPFEVTTFPFKHWKNSSLRYIPVTFRLQHSFSDNISLKDITSVVVKIQNTPMTPHQVSKLPLAILSVFCTQYLQQIARWGEYLYKNIKEYSVTPTSIVKWAAVKYLGTSSKKDYANAVWANICSNNDREFWVNFTISIRESLLPWLNPQMYIKYKDTKDNTRVNVAYDSQKRAMVEGRMQDIEALATEDLDVIN